MPNAPFEPSPNDATSGGEQTYSLQELANLSGTSLRTLRSWAAQRLLPSAGRGPYVRYPRGFLIRLQLIRTLQARNYPLAEIRSRLEGMTDEQIQQLLEQPSAPAPAVDGAAADYASLVLSSRGLSVPDPFSPRTTPTSNVNSVSIGASTLSGRTHSHRRSNWERIAFGSDLEVHVRRPLTREQNRRLDELLQLAAKLFVTDTPERD